MANNSPHAKKSRLPSARASSPSLPSGKRPTPATPADPRAARPVRPTKTSATAVTAAKPRCTPYPVAVPIPAQDERGRPEKHQFAIGCVLVMVTASVFFTGLLALIPLMKAARASDAARNVPAASAPAPARPAAVTPELPTDHASAPTYQSPPPQTRPDASGTQVDRHRRHAEVRVAASQTGHDFARRAEICGAPVLGPRETDAPPTPAAQRQGLTEAMLEEELGRVPEIALPELDELRGQEIAYAAARGNGTARNMRRDPVWEARIAAGLQRLLRQGRDAGLPMHTGLDCTLNSKAAVALGRGTVELHLPRNLATAAQSTFMTVPMTQDAHGYISIRDRSTGRIVSTFTALPRGALRSVDDLREVFRETWPRENVPRLMDVVPVVTQVLQAEGPAYRQLLVEELARLPGREAGVALARRALYDTAPAIRTAAIAALKQRPAEARATLLDGLRYPWSPVADHAADALIGTQDTAAIPELVALLGDRDPALAYRNEASRQYLVRELVGINHMRNCCLCHAPSYNSSDLVPGRVMEPGVPIPAEYYGSPNGAFVRADITFLRQDFSRLQRVLHAEPWPEMQRYDYVLRTRPATPEEIAHASATPAGTSYPQREAVLRALRQLTRRDLGSTTEAWQESLHVLPSRTHYNERQERT